MSRNGSRKFALVLKKKSQYLNSLLKASDGRLIKNSEKILLRREVQHTKKRHTPFFRERTNCHAC